MFRYSTLRQGSAKYCRYFSFCPPLDNIIAGSVPPIHVIKSYVLKKFLLSNEVALLTSHRQSLVWELGHTLFTACNFFTKVTQKTFYFPCLLCDVDEKVEMSSSYFQGIFFGRNAERGARTHATTFLTCQPHF